MKFFHETIHVLRRQPDYDAFLPVKLSVIHIVSP
jgi:hypothetical protein